MEAKEYTQESMTEAVAALLYNLIYDQGPNDNPWTKTRPRDDRAYLAFAESLVKAIQSNPDASDEAIIQQAKEGIDRARAGWMWDTIVIDEQYTSLTKEALQHIPAIKHFIEDPSPYFMEYEFLVETIHTK